ncbi:MAG: hypothetical protein LUG93_19725 [Lachnospiraceae bacterium]|nr:hypothetical protein [Lachnospiraceae bacterium]
MKWYRNLYIGKTFEGKKKRIMRCVRSGKPLKDLYLILLREDQEHNQLEIMEQPFLYKILPDTDSVLVVGAASGMSEARDLLIEMTDEVYHATGGVLLRDYILSRQMGDETQFTS